MSKRRSASSGALGCSCAAMIFICISGLSMIGSLFSSPSKPDAAEVKKSEAPPAPSQEIPYQLRTSPSQNSTPSYGAATSPVMDSQSVNTPPQANSSYSQQTYTAPESDHPAGATAKCNDGSYSFSANHRGTCSHHGGVAVWYR